MTEVDKNRVSVVLNYTAAAFMLLGACLGVGGVYLLLGTGAALLIGGVVVWLLGIAIGVAAKNVS